MPAGGERALDRLGDLLGRDAPAGGFRQHSFHRRRHMPVLRLQLGGNAHAFGFRAALVPDRRRDRARLDQRDLYARADELDAQRIGDRLDRVLGGRVWSE